MTQDAVTSLDRAGRRQQLPEEVAAYVRELIFSGAVRSGEFLRLEPIAEAVGVSNTPVREGLLSLRSEGFIRLVPRRGFMVAPFSRQDVRDMFWAQAQLGGELAARAAKKATPELVAQLESINQSFEQASSDDDVEAMARFGHAFHRAINLAADSPRLTLLMGSVANQLPLRFYAAIEGRLHDTEEQHPPLLEAVRGRKVRKVRSLMEQHILGGADRLIETLEQRGLWNAEEPAD
jgi:DNA-binding GntR family transcriptional regulator